jgi:Arc/MetJ-type ribon-helix-helix transcriptional regulator
MTVTPPTTAAIDALHHVAETLAVWIESGEFASVADYLRADLETLPETLREIGKELAQ